MGAPIIVLALMAQVGQANTGEGPVPESGNSQYIASPMISVGPEQGKKPEIRFEPTKAQQDKERVRGAREHTMEGIRALFQKNGLDYPPQTVLLRVLKNEDALELWVKGNKGQAFVWLKTYKICARSGSLGPKRVEGDGQVPEGYYIVTYFNFESSFHLSMSISYPNGSDKIRGDREHPGGDIAIHGSCVTIGCIPMEDGPIEEIYLIALDSKTKWGKWPLVHIFPGILDEAGMAELTAQFPDRPDLLKFWKELQVGYLLFEKNHQEPAFTIQKDGAYRFRP